MRVALGIGGRGGGSRHRADRHEREAEVVSFCNAMGGGADTTFHDIIEGGVKGG